jgi:hypothetical protein
MGIARVEIKAGASGFASRCRTPHHGAGERVMANDPVAHRQRATFGHPTRGRQRDRRSET